MGPVVKITLAVAVALLFVVATLVKIGVELFEEVDGEEEAGARGESRPNDSLPGNPSNSVQRGAGLR